MPKKSSVLWAQFEEKYRRNLTEKKGASGKKTEIIPPGEFTVRKEIVGG